MMNLKTIGKSFIVAVLLANGLCVSDLYAEVLEEKVVDVGEVVAAEKKDAQKEEEVYPYREDTLLRDVGDVVAAEKKDEQKEEKVYIYVEKKARFKGGNDELMNFLRNNIVYPEDAVKENIRGRVIVSFVVEKDGSISDIEVVRGVHPLLDVEAVRVVKLMPKWNPAELQGKPVRSKLTLPFNFKLPDPEEKQEVKATLEN